MRSAVCDPRERRDVTVFVADESGAQMRGKRAQEARPHNRIVHLHADLGEPVADFVDELGRTTVTQLHR